MEKVMGSVVEVAACSYILEKAIQIKSTPSR